jgi:hypothetical protein
MRLLLPILLLLLITLFLFAVLLAGTPHNAPPLGAGAALVQGGIADSR